MTPVSREGNSTISQTTAYDNQDCLASKMFVFECVRKNDRFLRNESYIIAQARIVLCCRNMSVSSVSST